MIYVFDEKEDKFVLCHFSIVSERRVCKTIHQRNKEIFFRKEEKMPLRRSGDVLGCFRKDGKARQPILPGSV